ncbi:MAG: bifunctional (p)ppGpp synthetase/guanosine-3',5'-bis(diphosphate) 3'-pyrophosphohydrolase [Oscillospiraceae bacterium]|nr:bifunctional (p)ppGpp synthetase/guanosine-3',5'-bis(diphosphate) 3'-pyrophosphohydrolase [Oscillospiraceae bacterium]
MESVSVRYDAMVQAVRRYAPYADMKRIDDAFHYAEEKHRQQKRKDGSPYIIHPLAVAEIVAEVGLDTDAILAALLHDCLEDTASTYDEISEKFSPTVAELVEGVTKLTRAPYSTAEEQQMENLRKMFLAMSKDIRVVLIKIADRLHNMRTLEYQTPEKQIAKSRETMDVYAPLAHRLGMQKLKWELEDVSLQYLDPDSYHDIMTYLDAHEAESLQFMNRVQDMLTERFQNVGIHCSITGRIKHVYSIYRKMQAQGKSIDELYDLYAFRVIVDTIPDCYNVLGHVHDIFTPVPGRFKDYISTPKPNMYQSLHTTVIGKAGVPFEVQIRTWEMHQTAEYGIAAHWRYKQGINKGSDEFDWVRQLLENQQDVEAEDYIHSLKVDMFDDEVFVFTPKGTVISLPAGSTPIDFAYAIHSGVGNAMVSAKVNNRIAGFDYTLKNGDIVEILTSKNPKGPSRDWLNICKSNQARIKIKQWFKKERREDNIASGRSSFEGELRRNSLSPSILQPGEEPLVTLLKKNGFETLDDLYATIGYGGITSLKAFNRAREELLRAGKPQKEESKEAAAATAVKQPQKADSGVIVEGIGSCMIKFSKCCTPVPGDEIIGFITKGYGVSIHRKDCPNVHPEQPDQRGRWVSVAWADNLEGLYPTSLEIESSDRTGMWMEITSVLSSMKLKITEISGRDLGGGRSVANVTFEVRDLEQLRTVRQKIRNISGVSAVRRITN